MYIGTAIPDDFSSILNPIPPHPYTPNPPSYHSLSSNTHSSARTEIQNLSLSLSLSIIFACNLNWLTFNTYFHMWDERDLISDRSVEFLINIIIIHNTTSQTLILKKKIKGNFFFIYFHISILVFKILLFNFYFGKILSLNHWTNSTPDCECDSYGGNVGTFSSHLFLSHRHRHTHILLHLLLFYLFIFFVYLFFIFLFFFK